MSAKRLLLTILAGGIIVGLCTWGLSSQSRVKVSVAATTPTVSAQPTVVLTLQPAVDESPSPAPAFGSAVSTVVSELRLSTSYDGMWEYLEYGQTVEFYHPEGDPSVYFHKSGRWDWDDAVLSVLEPPAFRSLSLALAGVDPATKFSIDYVIENGVVTLKQVRGEEGRLVWDEGQTLPPRPLNRLEMKGLETEFAPSAGQLLDSPPVGWSRTYSPLEAIGRTAIYIAQAKKASAWIFEWRGVDPLYRFIDPNGQTVQPLAGSWPSLYQIPASGQVVIQLADDRTCNQTVLGLDEASCDWETTAIFFVRPGQVICLDQIGSICEAGPAEWLIYSSGGYAGRLVEYLADQTKEIPVEMLEAALDSSE